MRDSGRCERGVGAVNRLDFLAWQRGESPTPYSSGDLADWQNAYNGGALAVATAEPEPNAGLLAVVLGGIWAGLPRRRQTTQNTN